MSIAPLSESSIRKLSISQRNLLISHIDGPVDVTVVDFHQTQPRRALMDLGMLRGSPAGTIRPRATALTERGRMAVAMVLGEYADALIRAGILKQQHPLEVLRRLKESRSGEHPSPAEGQRSSDVPLPGLVD